MARLTILICTHDRAALLERTLASLNAARRPAGWQVDLLVAANACTDSTHAFLEGYRREGTDRNWLPLEWQAVPMPGKSHALNSALPRVRAELVAFVDDDHRVESDYLVAICEAAERYPDSAIYCGRILPDWDGREPDWVHDLGPYRIYPLPVPRFDHGDATRMLTPDVAIPGGGNLCLRTEWIERVGPFSTDLGPVGHDLGGAEDMEWVLRAQRLGAGVRYNPRMIQYHYVDLSRLKTSYLMKKAYRRTASTIGLSGPPAPHGVPRYLYRKLGRYAVGALTALAQRRRRFYLVRTAAVLGEIAGYRRRQRSALPRAAEPHHDHRRHA